MSRSADIQSLEWRSLRELLLEEFGSTGELCEKFNEAIDRAYEAGRLAGERSGSETSEGTSSVANDDALIYEMAQIIDPYAFTKRIETMRGIRTAGVRQEAAAEKAREILRRQADTSGDHESKEGSNTSSATTEVGLWWEYGSEWYSRENFERLYPLNSAARDLAVAAKRYDTEGGWWARKDLTEAAFKWLKVSGTDGPDLLMVMLTPLQAEAINPNGLPKEEQDRAAGEARKAIREALERHRRKDQEEDKPDA